MTGSALITLIATILAVEAGIADIDVGSESGLRAGDDGMVFYEFEVGDQVKSVEIGRASIVETSAYTAKLGISPKLRVRSGFRIRFAIPRSRVEDGDDARGGDRTPLEATAFIAGTDGSCLNLRPTPATVSPPLACLAEGTKVTVLEASRGWKKARLADGTQGWLASRFLAGNDLPVENVTTDLPTTSPGGLEAGDVDRIAPASATLVDPVSRVNADEIFVQLDEADLEVQQLLGRVRESQAALTEAESTRAELSRQLLETTEAGLEARLALTRADLERTETNRAQLAGRLEKLIQDSQRLEEELETALVDARNIGAEREQLDTELAEARVELDEFKLLRDGLEADLAAARSDITAKIGERERLLAELGTARAELVQVGTIAEAAKDALGKEIRHTEATLAALHDRLALKEGELGQAETRLAAVDAERAALAAELSQFESGGKSSLKRELKQAKLDLREAAREKEALEVWLDERGRELAQAEARVAIMQSEIDRLESSAPSDRREIEATRVALKEARLRAVALEGRLAAKEQEAQAIQVELNSIRGELASFQRSRPESGTGSRDLPPDSGESGTDLVVLVSAQPCLNLRAEPSLEGKTFDCLEPGTQLGPLGHWEGWRYVELEDGRAGWVAGQHVGTPGTGG